jgi:hypothetical protein
VGGKFLNTSDIKESVHFILSHFETPGPLQTFPRKIMTVNYSGQFSVNSIEDTLKRYKEAEFKDCRINAYPETIENNGKLIQPPNFIFIDLDLSNFGNDITKLDKVKNNTIAKLESQEIVPTVTWTGNGYHIYIPLDTPILDHLDIFSRDKFPNLFSRRNKYHDYFVAEVFMQFAEQYYTNRNADPNHHPKFKTCLIRIPGTYNTKCLKSGKSLDQSNVTIIQKWNGKKGKAELLLQDFRIWLIQLEYNLQQKSIKKIRTNPKKPLYNCSSIRKIQKNSSFQSYSRIEWIEDLLQTPIEDHRKYCLWRIIAPYLLNLKQLSEIESARVMESWIDKCNVLRKLDFEPQRKIYEIIKYDKGFLPISKRNLKEENTWIFQIVELSSK